jgi:CRISPR-associated protein Csd2
MDGGERILVQSDDYRNDDCRSIKDRYDKNEKISSLDGKSSSDDIVKAACGEWFDVRAFGQVLAFKGKSDKEAGVSIAVRGPVSIQSAFSQETVDVESLQIIKSVNLETNDKDPSKKAGDTMGMKHRVSKGIYVSYGSINRQLAEKTGFLDEDAEKLKKAILKMFDNDESSARPAGSMEIIKVIWWTHTESTLSSAKVHRSLKINPDGSYELEQLHGITAQEINGE